jgi:hypothetical protein
MKRISYFDAAWDRRTLHGALRLNFDDRSQAEIRGLSMNELDLLCALLRAEKPVFYDEASERFTTDGTFPGPDAGGPADR